MMWGAHVLVDRRSIAYVSFAHNALYGRGFSAKFAY